MSQSFRIFLAPHPRTVADIFSAEDLAVMRSLGELDIYEGSSLDEADFDRRVAAADVVIGQIDLPESRLQRMPNLRAVFNVEGNFLPNIDYAACFQRGVRVLNVSPVFARPVAEATLGMAIALGRGLARWDRHFRDGTEAYGLEANAQAFSLYDLPVGFIGMGDLGRATLPLLAPFRCRVKAYDPWLPDALLRELGCQPASLDEVLQSSRLVIVVAGATSENQGLLDADHFASMQAGAGLVLVSRAGVVDFEAMLDAAERGHIRVATDVFPEEPLGRQHRARQIDSVLLSPHQAGALQRVLRDIGALVLADLKLVARGLVPVMCKPAAPETASRLRSKPVAKS